MRYNVVSQHFALYYNALQRTTRHYILFFNSIKHYNIRVFSFVAEVPTLSNVLSISIVVLVVRIFYENTPL